MMKILFNLTSQKMKRLAFLSTLVLATLLAWYIGYRSWAVAPGVLSLVWSIVVLIWTMIPLPVIWLGTRK